MNDEACSGIDRVRERGSGGERWTVPPPRPQPRRRQTMSNNGYMMRNSTMSDPGYRTQMSNGGMGGGDGGEPVKQRRLTAYERLSYDLSNDQKCIKEITLGKRIGFYRIRGELGTGNFSQVKLGIHALTKGEHRSLFLLSGLGNGGPMIDLSRQSVDLKTELINRLRNL